MEPVSNVKLGISVPLRKLDGQTRWKWMAGSAAAMVTGVAQADTVQITQVDNSFFTGTSFLKTDLTGDLISDVGLVGNSTVSNSVISARGVPYDVSNNQVAVYMDGTVEIGRARGRYFDSTSDPGAYTFNNFTVSAGVGSGFVSLKSGTSTNAGSGNPVSVNGLVPLTFTDPRINSNQPTNGFLDMRAFNLDVSTHGVQIVRLVFDDSSTSAPAGVVPGGVNTEFAPEIDILGNGNSIATGDATPDMADGTDFGRTTLGSVVSHTFEIHNTGNALLRVGATDPSPGEFLVSDLSLELAPGASQIFTIEFAPVSVGSKFAIIAINSSDADESAYSFLVAGVGVGPEVAAPAMANSNEALQTAFTNKIKKLKKSFKKAKSSGNSAKARKIKAQIKKFKKKLAAL